MFPLVSICIPTYNGDKYLHDALKSIVDQTYSNIEVIISDDQSKDSTLKIVQVFKANNHFPVHIFHHTPSSIGANWNNCMKNANGEYIKFLFQDDVLFPRCIEIMVKAFQLHPNVGLVASQRDFLVEGDNKEEFEQWIKTYENLHSKFDTSNELTILNNDIFKEDYFLKPPFNKIGEPTTVMFKRNLIKDLGYYSEEMQQKLDYAYFYRILKHYPIAIINQALVYFRLHDQQATHINKVREIPDDFLYEKLLYTEFLSLLHPQVQDRLRAKYHPVNRVLSGMRSKWKRIKKGFSNG
jgi:glycosyltransferase involved in cell wall biosynthesis